MLGMTLYGYYIERYTAFAWWDGIKTRYEFVPSEVYQQNLTTGLTFVAFFLVVGALFSFVLLYFDEQDELAVE